MLLCLNNLMMRLLCEVVVTPSIFDFHLLGNPFVLLSLINHSMFACHTRQMFFELYVQTYIRCTVSSVHYHLCVIPFPPLTVSQLTLVGREIFCQ